METNKKLAIEWLKAANDDLKNIGYIIKVVHLLNIVAFHSHQAIEKSLKSLLEYKKVGFIKTNNLEKLYKSIDELDYEQLMLLNELYIDSRYPGDIELLPNDKATIEDAKEFYSFEKSVFDKVCEILETDKEELR